MRRLATLLVLALVLAACRDGSPTGTGIFSLQPAQGDTATGTGSVAELRLMQRRWADARDGRDYQFETYYSCYCAGDVHTPVRVRVSGSRVVEVREIEAGTVRRTDWYYTIDELFDRAIALREQGGRVRVTYAVGAGYPVWIEIGTPENDAGVIYFIRSVTVGR